MNSLRLCFCIAFLLAASTLTACGSDSESDSSNGDAATSPPATPTSAAGVTQASGSDSPSAEALELDVCELITQEEVEEAIGEASGPPTFTEIDPSMAAVGIGGGDCRFESNDITPVVDISILAWPDEDSAQASFELTEGQYPSVDGLGDKAARTQPIGDVSVLSGTYEIAVDLYFISEDDDAELEMARDIAEIVVSRLP